MGLDETVERDLQGEQCRLGVLRLVEKPLLPIVGRRPDHLTQRPRQQTIQLPAHLIPGPRKHRIGLIQLPAHPQPLRTLTGEQHTDPALTSHRTSDRASHRRQIPQSRKQRLPVITRDHGTVFQPRTTGRKRKPDVSKPQLRTPCRPRRKPLRLTRQRLRRTSRKHPRHRPRHHRSNRLCPLLLRRLLQHHMRIRPTDAERRHTRPTGTAGVRPFLCFREQLDSARGPVDMRGGLVHVQGLGQNPLSHGKDHLHHARDTGRGLGVSEVGLDRTEPQWLVGGPVLSVRGEQRLGLDRVAQPRTGAVRLHRVHLGRRQPRTRQRLSDHPLLRGSVRRGQTVGRTVLVHRRTPHHRQDRMPVTAGIGEPLHEQHADALAPTGAVRGRGERLAAAVRRETALPGEVDEGVGSGHHRDTAGQGHRALPGTQRLHRPVQCHQRGRARRVHGDRGTLESEHVRDPARHHTGRGSGDQVAVRVVRTLGEDRAVVLAVGADKDSGVAAAEGGRVDARVLQGLPGGLQQEPLLRIHRGRLTRRDPEEAGVEFPGAAEEAALAHIRGALVLRVRVIQPLDVPATVGREVTDRITATCQQVPQRLGAVDPAGEPAGHSDDGDGLVVHGRRGPYRGEGGLPSEQFLPEVAHHRARGGVVEDQRGRKPQTGGVVHPVAQFHRGE